MSFDLSRVRGFGSTCRGLAAGFTDHVMVQRGYRPISGAQTYLAVKQFEQLAWLVSEGLGVEEFRREGSRTVSAQPVMQPVTHALPSIGAMEPILGYLRGLGITPAAASPAPTTGALEAARWSDTGVI